MAKEKDRTRVVAVSLAAALTVVWMLGGYYYCDFIPVPKTTDLSTTAVYYARCCMLPCGVFLAFSVISVIYKRVTTPAGDPLSGKEHLLQAEKNILSNTVEQSLLFLLVAGVLSTYLDRYEMKILPLYGSFWMIGRILFTIGYRIHPKYRALGMLCNMFSTINLLLVAIYLVFSRGFWYELDTTSSAIQSIDVNGLKEEL